MGHRPDYRIKRSVNIDPEMAAWIKERAKAQSTSENTVVRQALRAAMNRAVTQTPPADATAGGEG